MITESKKGLLDEEIKKDYYQCRYCGKYHIIESTKYCDCKDSIEKLEKYKHTIHKGLTDAQRLNYYKRASKLFPQT